MVTQYHKLGGLGYFGSGIGLSATIFLGVMLKEHGKYGPEIIGVVTSAFELSLLTLMPLMLSLVDKFGGLRWMLTAITALASGLLFLACTTDDQVMMAVWVAIFLLVLAPAPRLWDRAVLEFLGKSESQNWGRYRLFQSIFFGAGAPLCAALRHKIGWVAISLQFVVGYSFVIVAPHYWWKEHKRPDNVALSVQTESSPSDSDKNAFSQISRAAKIIRSDRRLWLFLVANTLLGFPFAIVQYFLPVHMKDLGASNLLVGFSTAVTTATEAIVFMFGETFLGRFQLEKVYAVGLGAMILRLAGYAAVTEAWMILPVDLLHGGSYAATWLATVQLYSKKIPDDLGSTGFGILSMFSYGVGPMVGNICGGLIFSHWDARVMFGSACGLTCLILVMFVALAPRKAFSCKELEPQDEIVENSAPTSEKGPAVDNSSVFRETSPLISTTSGNI